MGEIRITLSDPDFHIYSLFLDGKFEMKGTMEEIMRHISDLTNEK